jgi:hypothetical protein
MEPLDQLPKGTKGEPTSCPLAIALDHGWAVGGCDVEGVAPKARKTLLAVWADDLPDERVTDDEGYDVDWVELPGPLSEFVDRFDSDEFPELIERDE